MKFRHVYYVRFIQDTDEPEPMEGIEETADFLKQELEAGRWMVDRTETKHPFWNFANVNKPYIYTKPTQNKGEDK